MLATHHLLCDLKSLEQIRTIDSKFEEWCDTVIMKRLRSEFTPWQLLWGMKKGIEGIIAPSHGPYDICANLGCWTCCCPADTQDWFSTLRMDKIKMGYGKDLAGARKLKLPWYYISSKPFKEENTTFYVDNDKHKSKGFDWSICINGLIAS